MWRKNKINRDASVVALVARVNSDCLGYKASLTWERQSCLPKSSKHMA